MKVKKQRQLFFLSGTDTSDNKKALLHLAKTTKSKRKITFIPSQNFDSEDEYSTLKKDFKKIGFKRFEYLPLDKNFSKSKFKDSLDSDVIFLGGGNTFYFMDFLRKRRISKDLKDFTYQGGTLVGLSAGALLMTPSIILGGFPREDADDNDVNLLKTKGLNLVSFEICPHYKKSTKIIGDLKAYSSLYLNPVYGLKDGEFIYVNGNQIFFSGKTPMFKNGSKINLS